LIELEDIDSLDAFGDFTDDVIENMAKRNGASPVPFGICRIFKMKVFNFTRDAFVMLSDRTY
jgi:hypothetical protein